MRQARPGEAQQETDSLDDGWLVHLIVGVTDAGPKARSVSAEDVGEGDS